MADKIFGIPYDEEIFVNAWQSEPDMASLALLQSGVMVDDPIVAGAIGTDSNFYTIPFYNILGGDAANYDGATDVPITETSGDFQSGIVYGRTKGWKARDFVRDMTSGDPLGHIARSVARYWAKQRHNILLSVLDGIFGITDFATSNVQDIAASHTTQVKMGETTLADLAVDTMGENADAYSVVIMHSTVAHNLAKLQLLDYEKGVDGLALQNGLRLARLHGMTVIIDDRVPVDRTTVGFPKYSTYMLGQGVLRKASGSLLVPVEPYRDPIRNGGEEGIITRIRETVHPNGFSFAKPVSGFTGSPTNIQLATADNWSLEYPGSALPLAKVITNG